MAHVLFHTPEEMADPDNTYMTSEPQTVLIRGAGGIEIIYERRPKTRLERAGGKVEYYIEDVNTPINIDLWFQPMSFPLILILLSKNLTAWDSF